jgi:hypothetical protein
MPLQLDFIGLWFISCTFRCLVSQALSSVRISEKISQAFSMLVVRSASHHSHHVMLHVPQTCLGHFFLCYMPQLIHTTRQVYKARLVKICLRGFSKWKRLDWFLPKICGGARMVGQEFISEHVEKNSEEHRYIQLT